MPIRVRAIFVIILTNLIIILFSVFSGIRYAGRNIERAIETDMAVVADIADNFISAEIELLKLKAANIAAALAGADALWSEILAEQETRYPEFIGMTIFDDELGIAAQAGTKPAPAEMIDNKHIQESFGGKWIFTSTHVYPDGIVLYLAVPIPGRHRCVLALTLPGMHFSDLLAGFVIWKTGHIFIDDADGYVIANIREQWVNERFNFILMAESDSQYEGIASAVRRMITGETGITLFSIAGIPRICAYRPIEGSEAGWSLGVVAPIPESAVTEVNRGLLLVGFISFLLSVLAAFIASGFIKKPFEEVAALKEAAEASSASKTNFLATMSHEMRTPLNAVIGLSELTLDGNIDGDERENIEKIYSSGSTLLGIINDILDISKIESGKFELNPIEYDVPSLINDTISLNIMRIEEKPIQFNLSLDDTIPARLSGDDLRVKQVFNNVLSNAFKYTRAGTVEWRVTWEKDGGYIWLVSSVSDTGIGIRSADIPKLFTNYSQVDTCSNRKIEGTGLGLSLTKRMVALMNGEISVESEYGKGSVFTLRIRQGYVTDTPIGAAVAESLKNFHYSDRKKRMQSRLIHVHLPHARVLVVDDIPTNLTVVRGIMKPYCMQVDCVGSGTEAVSLIRSGVKYDAIFMDHMMPEMDGIETVRVIRNEIDSDYARTVPIIALTANAIRGTEEMFLQSGFQAFLSKPIDLAKMDAVIRHWVRDKDRNKFN